MTNQTLASVVKKAEKLLDASWRSVYETDKEELCRMFGEFGDRAYGVWIQRFMAPVLEQLQADGYEVKAGFNRADSVEKWGPPEERERCIWYIIRSGEGTPLGAVVLQVYHSHRSFHFPRAPRLFALEAAEREPILSALSDASVRVRWDRPEERLEPSADLPAPPVRWEYATDISLADNLREVKEGELQSWSLDEALSHWGRYGWELVSVMPADGRVIAYFKRPRPA